MKLGSQRSKLLQADIEDSDCADAQADPSLHWAYMQSCRKRSYGYRMCREKKMAVFKSYEPAHDNTYNKTCATSENTDQTAHPRSLIIVFADRLCLLQPPGHPKRDKREPLPYWVDVQAELRLCWSRRSYCRFCRALAHMPTAQAQISLWLISVFWCSLQYQIVL